MDAVWCKYVFCIYRYYWIPHVMLKICDFIFFRTFKSYEELATGYESGELHPGDLKPSLSKAINLILQVHI